MKIERMNAVLLAYSTVVGLAVALAVSWFFPLTSENHRISQILSSEGNAQYLPLVRQKVAFILTLGFVFFIQILSRRFLLTRLKRELPLVLGSLLALFSLYGSACEILISSQFETFSIISFFILFISGGLALVSK